MDQKLFLEEVVAMRSKVEHVERLRESKKYDEALCVLKSILENHHSENYDTGLINMVIKKQIAELTAEKAAELIERGEYREAQSAFGDALNSSGSSIDGKEKLCTKTGVALSLLEQGNHEKSYKMFKEILESQKQLLGSNHEDYLATQSNLARVLDKLGKFDLSLSLYSEALDKMSNKLGADDPLTLTTRMNMGVVLLKIGRHRDAMKCFDEVLEMRGRILGPEDPETLMAKNNLAKALLALKRFEDALKMFTDVWDKRKVALGPDHPHTLMSHTHMGLILFERGNNFEALKIFYQVVEKQKTVLGDEHPDTRGTKQCIEKLRSRAGHKKFSELKARCATHYDLIKLCEFINSGNEQGVNDLLKDGFDIAQAAADKGNTPLHIAVNKNNIAIVELLLGYAKQCLSPKELVDFIDARTTSAVGNTALHIAASNGCLAPIKSLIRYGATHNIKNKKGKTPYEQTNDQGVKSFLGSI